MEGVQDDFQVQAGPFSSCPSCKLHANLHWARKKNNNIQSCLPSWDYLETTAGWVSLPGGLLLNTQSSWIPPIQANSGPYFWWWLKPWLQHFPHFGAEWCSQVRLMVTLVVGFRLHNYTSVSKKTNDQLLYQGPVKLRPLYALPCIAWNVLILGWFLKYSHRKLYGNCHSMGLAKH